MENYRKRDKIPVKPYWDLFSPQSKRTRGITRDNSYAVFDFYRERPRSLFTVPSSWISTSSTEADGTSACFWPSPGSKDERNLSTLVSECSLPNKTAWVVLPGKTKGYFNSQDDAEKYLDSMIGTRSSDSECERARSISAGVMNFLQSRSSDTSNRSPSSINRGSKDKQHILQDDSNRRINSFSVNHESISQDHFNDSRSPSIKRSCIDAEVSKASHPDEVNTEARSLSERPLDEKVDVILEFIEKKWKPSIREMKTKLDRLLEREEMETTGTMKFSGVADDALEKFKIPVSAESTLDELEGRLSRSPILRSELRKSLFSMAPKDKGIGKGRTDTPYIARVVCRLIAPDEILQFYTRDPSTKSKKKPLSSTYPRIHQAIASVVMKSAVVGVQQALTGISAHLARCSDRRKSKHFLQTHSQISESQSSINESPIDSHDTVSVSSETSDINDSN